MSATAPGPDALTAASDPTAFSTPSLRRRLAAMLYESVMLFGVGLIPAVLATALIQLLGNGNLAKLTPQVVGFVCFGTYFVWLWTKSGQTLPMQTWRIKLVADNGQQVDRKRAAIRYLLCWFWVAPAVLISMLFGWSKWQMIWTVGSWAVGYALLALLLRDKQFLHDRLAGTRLIDTPRNAEPR